uniref:Uncharacterized protein n=1 Tax=Rhipicephalus zambeziensis TaxID=60191 RepID=A0A224YGZ5_9ACAR
MCAFLDQWAVRMRYQDIVSYMVSFYYHILCASRTLKHFHRCNGYGSTTSSPAVHPLSFTQYVPYDALHCGRKIDEKRCTGPFFRSKITRFAFDLLAAMSSCQGLLLYGLLRSPRSLEALCYIQCGAGGRERLFRYCTSSRHVSRMSNFVAHINRTRYTSPTTHNFKDISFHTTRRAAHMHTHHVHIFLHIFLVHFFTVNDSMLLLR